MLYGYSEEEVRSICRSSIESFEKWARVIIDMKLKEQYGQNYFNATINDEYIIKKEIRDKANDMLRNHPDRFNKEIDTLFLEEIIYLLCKDKLYKNSFKSFLDIMYPDGRSEVRTFLERLIPIRNKLSHSNPLSIREAEQCICYSNDFIQGIKEYFKMIGEDRVYNVPNAIKLIDSLGNTYNLNNEKSFESIYVNNNSSNDLYKFKIGDRYSAWLQLDPSFDKSEYIFRWNVEGKWTLLSTESRIDLEITEDLINIHQAIYCTIKSTKSWHKYGTYDQQFAIVFQVLPPRG